MMVSYLWQRRRAATRLLRWHEQVVSTETASIAAVYHVRKQAAATSSQIFQISLQRPNSSRVAVEFVVTVRLVTLKSIFELCPLKCENVN